jgi:hypothetical protein
MSQLRPSLDLMMTIWADKGNADVAAYLDAPTVNIGMRQFKRAYLYPYAIKRTGGIPLTHEQHESLKEMWREERSVVHELQ